MQKFERKELNLQNFDQRRHIDKTDSRGSQQKICDRWLIAKENSWFQTKKKD